MTLNTCKLSIIKKNAIVSGGYCYLFLYICLFAFPIHLEAQGKPYQANDMTLLLLHFDESEGIPQNSSRYKVKILSNTTKRVEGKFGKALYFDGIQNRINLGNADIFNPDSEEFTIEAWIKPDPSTPSYSGIVSKIPFYVDSGYTLFLFNGKLRFVFRDASGVKRDIIGITDIRDGKWHHVAVTFNGSAVKMYLDGKVEKKLNFPPTRISTNSKALIIGAHPNWAVGKGKMMYFKGAMDELRISNKVCNDFSAYKNPFPYESHGFGGLLWPAKWYDNTVYMAKGIPQMITVPYYNPTRESIHNVSIVLDVPEGFVIESVFRPGKAILGEKLDWLKGMKITSTKLKKGKENYIRYQINFASHFVIPAGFGTDNTRVMEKKYVSHWGPITLLTCSHLKPGSYPITLRFVGQTEKSQGKCLGNSAQYTLKVLPEPPKVALPDRFYLGFWQVAWDYKVIPLQVFKRLFEGYSRIGINTVCIFGTCTKEVAKLAQNFGIRILICETNPLSKKKDIGRGKEAINVNGKHLHNIWSPAYFVSRSKEVMQSIDEKVKRLIDSGAHGIAFDWEGGHGVNISISEYDRVAFLDYLKKRGVDVRGINWPDDIKKDGKLFEPYWVDFRTGQRKEILKIYVESVKKEVPDAIFSSYCGFPPFDSAHRQHYLYGYGVDVLKESKCVDILSPGNYANFKLCHKRSLELIKLVGGAKYVPCLMGGNTYADAPIFSQDRGIAPAITAIEAGDVLGLGGRGFIFYQEGRIDGRIITLFARCASSINGVAAVFIKGKRIDSLFEIRGFRGYVYPYAFKDKIVAVVVPRDVKTNAWKTTIILPMEIKEELVVNNLSDQIRMGCLKAGETMEISLTGTNFTVLSFSAVSKQDITSELSGKAIEMRFADSESVSSKDTKKSYNEVLPEKSLKKRKNKNNELDMGFD